jgi:hypothetical protein
MKHLRRIFLRFYLLFANSKVEAELAREIGAHLALLEDEYLRQGMPLKVHDGRPDSPTEVWSRRSNCIATSEHFKGWARFCKTLDIPSANYVSLPDLQ